MLKIRVLCGGSPAESGISLNSARSFMDHADGVLAEVRTLYRHANGAFYVVDKRQLYSNTPVDFAYQLERAGRALGAKELERELRNVDLVVPLIHGVGGEDGDLQAYLEERKIPFVGSPSATCRKIFSKLHANNFLESLGFGVLPHKAVGKPEDVRKFMTDVGGAVVLKPSLGGSSVGVSFLKHTAEVEEAYAGIQKLGFRELMVETRVEKGVEFTIIVLEGEDGPVALIPSTIHVGKREFFDFRHKYLPQANVRMSCPGALPVGTLRRIRGAAEELFRKSGARDILRIDGWAIGERLLFTDFNTVPGMEQNSFVFQQGAKSGLSHRDVLQHILEGAVARHGKTVHVQPPRGQKNRRKVDVVFGGGSSERQVSVMSGTNVWLKLRASERDAAEPYLLNMAENTVWSLPYALTLYHTAEEIEEQCVHFAEGLEIWRNFAAEISKRLGRPPYEPTPPRPFSLEDFMRHLKTRHAFCFLGLHGGIGEDGTLARMLERASVPFNGSLSALGRLCIDKIQTGKAVEALEVRELQVLPKESVALSEDWDAAWRRLRERYPHIRRWIVKPRCDGCSVGVARLDTAKDAETYAAYCRAGKAALPAACLSYGNERLDLSSGKEYFFEPFIEVDRVSISQRHLTHTSVAGYMELTVGFVERGGEVFVFLPSLTVAVSHVLSMEEKFQGGTGVNLTPPPGDLLSDSDLERVRGAVKTLVLRLGLKNYGRVDLFFHRPTGTVWIIEVNTLPALTPSTVLYHQAYLPPLSLSPRPFLEYLIDSALPDDR